MAQDQKSGAASEDAGAAVVEQPIRLISVILPCYNGAATLRVQLEALARQQVARDWQLVFVDNGSTDSSVEIVESFRDRFPHVLVVSASPKGRPLGGVDHSYRVGLRAAQGDAFLFCESDDEVGERWLEVMSSALDRASFVACALEYGRLNAPELSARDGVFQSKSAGLPRMMGPLFLHHSSGAAMGFRRSLWEKIGDPAGGWLWDVDFSWRVQQAGYELTWVSETEVHYRLRSDANSRFRQGQKMGQARQYLIRKYSRPKPVKYIVHSLYEVARTSLNLLVGTVTGKQKYALSIWDLGHAVGLLQGVPELFQKREMESTVSANAHSLTQKGS